MAVGAAVLETLASQVPEVCAARSPLALTGAVLIAGLAVVGKYKMGPDRVRAWIRARSASEGLKSEVYLYATRSGAYREGDPRAVLADRIDEILGSVSDLGGLVVGVAKRRSPMPSDPMSFRQYVSVRVDDQIEDYYRPQARREGRSITRYRWIEFCLSMLAATLAAVQGVTAWNHLSPWVPVLTTAIVAVAARLASGRHEFQVTTYTATALQLEKLRGRFEDARRGRPPRPEDFERLVVACERTISAETQGWMGLWKEPGP